MRSFYTCSLRVPFTLLLVCLLGTANGQLSLHQHNNKKKRTNRAVPTQKVDPYVLPADAGAVTSATLKTTQFKPGDIYGPYVGRKFSQGPASVRKIALSFDDGPSGQLTPKVLEILQREKIPATFFMLGQSVEKYPDTAKMVATAGFEIGCHSYHHPNMRSMGEGEIRDEIDSSAGLIEKVTGKKVRLFRPPYGTITAAVRKASYDSGMVIVHWSVDPRDWSPKSTPDSVYQQAMKQTMNGSIFCIHDVHARTIEALPRIITDLKAKGFEFTNVSGLLAEAEKHQGEIAARGGVAAAGPDSGSSGGGVEASAPSMKPAAIPLNQSAPK